MNKNTSTKNRVLISEEKLSIEVELNNTATAQQVYAALPFRLKTIANGSNIQVSRMIE